MLASFKAQSFGSQTLTSVARSVGFEVIVGAVLRTFRGSNFASQAWTPIARSLGAAQAALAINQYYISYYELRDYVSYLLAKDYNADYNVVYSAVYNEE